MSFKPIRTFLEDRLLDVDDDFELFDEAFNSNEVGSNRFDKRYHIFYGPVDTTSANQNVTNDQVTAIVTLYFKGARNSIEALDNGMDLANEYRIECLKRSNYTNQTFIKNVVCKRITPEQIASSNDNEIKISLEFSISVIFGIGVNLDN